MITCSTLPGRAVCGLVWDMGRKTNMEYLELALSGIPEGFAGRPLEVPAGTGVLTMRGAYRETFRVLKPGGIFCGCFYVKGETRRTGWFIDDLYTLKGFFTPPFEIADSLRERLVGMYPMVELETVRPMACFTCRKG